MPVDWLKDVGLKWANILLSNMAASDSVQLSARLALTAMSGHQAHETSDDRFTFTIG
ncbi:hypothetical protein AB4142_26635 [Variovorax sp. 2RAF20]|uniref:hypothetical protein n=1 Tax=unclassified Variovorax TaxID=663243 RepID=UPI000BC95E88|nr:hypothetical protein [Variovorax sp. YR752]SOE06411.1 hypothetical protein SAMN05518800_7063 [Variovorax sp. YR752]